MERSPTWLKRADGRAMAYRTLGDGPPLVCAAGGPGADAGYLEDLGGLSGRYRLVIPDARGTGRSEPAASDDGYGFDVIAHDLEVLREHLGLKRMALLAHSAACTTALVYAAARPDRLQAVVLIAPSARLLDDVEDDTGRILSTRSDEPWYAAAVAARRLLRAGADPDEVPALIEAIAPASYASWGDREQTHAAKMRPSNWAAATSFWQAEVSESTVRAGLEHVQAPVLVVTGDLDAATGVNAGAAWARALPNGRHVTVPASGHHPWVDRPGAFNQLVAEFLSDADF